MKSPTFENIVILDEVASTQDAAASLLATGSQTGVVLARHQTGGRGRLGRTWLSDPADSLTFSLIFHAYADHPQAHLVGMAAALGAAGALHSELRWPNDLIFGKRKVGGILTELKPNAQGAKVPIVGIGINLNQTVFPDEVADIATSLALQQGRRFDAEEVARAILGRIALLPEPNSWADLAHIWDVFDRTPGKQYRLASGETAIGLGVGSEGQLLCAVDGESRTVLAAEALFGPGNS